MPKSVPNSPSVSSDRFPALQREAIEALCHLSSGQTAPAENKVLSEYEKIRESAEKQLADTMTTLRTQLNSKTAVAEKKCAETVAKLNTNFQHALGVLDHNITTHKKQIDATFDEEKYDATRQREENVLMIETASESTFNALKQHYRELFAILDTNRGKIAHLKALFDQTLQEYRYSKPAPATSSSPLSGKPSEIYAQTAEVATEKLNILRNLRIPRILGTFAVAATIISIVMLGALAAISYTSDIAMPPFTIVGPVALVGWVIIAFIVARLMRKKANSQIAALCVPFFEAITKSEQALSQQIRAAKTQQETDEKAAHDKRAADLAAAEQAFTRTIENIQKQTDDATNHLTNSEQTKKAELKHKFDEAVAQAEQTRDSHIAQAQSRYDKELADAQSSYDRQIAEFSNRRDTDLFSIDSDWRLKLTQIETLINESRRLDLEPRFDWEMQSAAQWRIPTTFPGQISFGHLTLNLDALPAAIRGRAKTLHREPDDIAIPTFLAFPNRCSVFLESDANTRSEAIACIRTIMLRLLTSLPPGRVQFTVIDPIGLGENFAGFMHLVDYEEAIVNSRIWTETPQIDAKLAELTNHMENVIQKYLRNEFATIDEYNQQAGPLAEPYRFLVIADFPSHFGDDAIRRLNSIITSGARCGVFTLIAHDQRQPIPSELQLDELSHNSIHLAATGDAFAFADESMREFPVTLDTPPSEDKLTEIIHRVGESAVDSLKVEVPFQAIAPNDTDIWSANTSKGLSIPIGNTGAVRVQKFELGKGSAQHALIAGKTGSGKSTLLHVIVTNLALWYSPDEIELYLVDFKKGVEFKTYVTHQLPHAKAIAIESDREFGVSVLQRIDAEMHQRGELFRHANVQDVAAYREATAEKMPRILLIVDEFQVFFAEDDKLAQDASLLIDRLVRQGRAFGIHLLLGSQSLGGMVGLSRSTLGQMAVRMALQCSESDSQLILDDTNIAARMLTRPGEAIYNDNGGLVDGNSPFQTAWLPDSERQTLLMKIHEKTESADMPTPSTVVFEGNAPADIRNNTPLTRLIENGAADRPPVPTTWLGEAVAIKEPTHVRFSRQSGAHLMIVGQRDDLALSQMTTSLLSLSLQHAPDNARFVILDGRTADDHNNDCLKAMAETLPHDTRLVDSRAIPESINEIATELQFRLDNDDHDRPAIFLMIHGLQRFRVLRRQEDDFSFSTDDEDKPPAPDKQLAEIVREGPSVGIHVIVWADTLATVDRSFDRATVNEFDNRVLFQMSASDSSNLIDSPIANTLGLYRALLYSEEAGRIEKFRPWDTPSPEWIELVKATISKD